MFASLGYISLAEVVSNMETSINQTGQRQEIGRKTLDFFAQIPSLSVCLPSGGIVRLAPQALNFTIIVGRVIASAHPCINTAWLIDTDQAHAALRSTAKRVDDALETLRKSPKDDDGKALHGREDAFRVMHLSQELKKAIKIFTPLIGGSIQILTSHAPNNPQDILDCKSKPLLFNEKSGDMVNDVLELIESEPKLRRSDIKQRLFPDLKTDAFRAVWREAAMVRPSISRPGPK